MAMFYSSDISEIIEPPQPLQKKLYLCDKRFHTDLLRELEETHAEYLYVIITGSGYDLFALGGSVRHIYSKSVSLPNKHNKGGQSQNRYQRLHKEAIGLYVQSIVENVKPRVSEFDGLVLAGPADIKNHVGEHFDTIAIVDTAYSGRAGFNEAFEKTRNLLNTELNKEVEVVSRFFDMIATDNPLYTYGKDETIRALESGMVETLLIGPNEPEYDVESFGSDVFIVSGETPIGHQFLQSFGIGAILRYSL